MLEGDARPWATVDLSRSSWGLDADHMKYILLPKHPQLGALGS